MNIVKKTLYFFKLFLLIAGPQLLFAQEPVFELTYKIRLNGLFCGRMTFSLERVSEHSYEAKQIWLSQILFFSLDQKEISEFSIADKKILPLQYTFSREQVGSKKHYAYLFSEEEKSQNKFDRLSFQIILMRKLLENLPIEEKTVTLVDDRGLYQIDPAIERNHGETSVSFSYKKREHEIVFDEKIQYLPVRFSQKRGPLHFEGELEHSAINTDYWSKRSF